MIIKFFIKFGFRFFFSFSSFLKVLFFSKYKVKLNSVEDFGECFILGNGPSLKDDLDNNLTFLATQKLFVVNNFAVSNYYKVLKPKYYVFADPAYWSCENNAVVKNCRLTLEIIRDNTNWEMVILVPNIALKNEIITSISNVNKFITIADFNTTFISNKGFVRLNHFLYKKSLAAPRIQNVLISAIYISINIGFSEVNILGSDHSWTKELYVNDENQVCTIDSHFYDETMIKFNVFKRLDGSVYKMHEILRDYALMFEGYYALKNYADFFKVKIYNRTKNSYIDAFDRKIFNNN